MISTEYLSPSEIALEIARRAQEKRLSFNLSQKSLSERSGVSLGVIKKFENSGKISLESLIKLALVLESLRDFAELFKLKSSHQYPSLDLLLKQKTRKRGRQ